MRERKNVVLLFSKVPEAGLVKTRLSILKDGMFPPETACELYRCMLLDVVEIICAALDDMDDRLAGVDVVDRYELVVSTTPAANVPVMQQLLAGEGYSRSVTVICDEGASFDEHYNDAFEQCWERGADCILSMGADMPALTKADIRFGFEQLHRLCDTPGGGIVLAPDQEMGVSVVGWTRDTLDRTASEPESCDMADRRAGEPGSRDATDHAADVPGSRDAVGRGAGKPGARFDHSGVFYNADGLTVLPAYIAKARAAGLPALWLPPIPDVDTMMDFFHNVTLVHALAYCADFDDVVPARRTAQAFIDLGFRDIRVAPNNLFDPRDHIDQA